MKKFFRFFTRELGSNVAQLLIIVFIFPSLAYVLSLIFGSSGGQDAFISLVEKIPLCSRWIDILKKYLTGMDITAMGNSISMVIMKSFPETLFTAIAIFIFDSIYDLIGGKGLHILSAMFGVVFSTFVLKAVGLTQNDALEIMIEFGFIILLLIAMFILIRAKPPSVRFGFIKRVFQFIIEALLAVSITAYIATIALLAAGAYPTFSVGLRVMAVVTGVTVLYAVISYIVSRSVKKDLALPKKRR